MEKIYLNADEAVEIIKQQGLEYAVMHNPEHVFPAVEVFPLANKITTPREKLEAILLEMEGTILSTENLRLHALENMVRQISGRITKEEWHGLDYIIDYPNLTGSTTIRYIEFLVSRYNNFIKQDILKESFFYSALWILILSQSEDLKSDVRKALINAGCGNILKDEKLPEFVAGKKFDKYNSHLLTNYFVYNYGKDFKISNFHQLPNIAQVIYNYNYFLTLGTIKNGTASVQEEVFFGNKSKHFIEQSTGVAFFLALTKGLLGNDIRPVLKDLELNSKSKLLQVFPQINFNEVENNISSLGTYFEKEPVKLALITSSSKYETEILLNEVFKHIGKEIESWNVPDPLKNKIAGYFSDYRKVFETSITSQDSESNKFKPHRDYFRHALANLNIHKKDFYKAAGIGTNESSVLAIRAAGIGLCIAVPFARTEGHDFSAASFVLHNGIPEALIIHNLFMNKVPSL